MINDNFQGLECSEEDVVALNVYETDEKFVEQYLVNRGKKDELSGLKLWQLSCLSNIRDSDKSMSEKLIDVAESWACFGYPKEWGGFIHYMPGEVDKYPEDMYQKFLDYIGAQKIKLVGDPVSQETSPNSKL